MTIARFTFFTNSFFVTAKEYNQVQVGVHETGSGEQDVPPLKHWEQRWEAEKMPRRLPRVGIEMEIIPDFLHQALKLAENFPHVTLKLLHSSKDVELALSQPRDEMMRTLHVTSSPSLIDAPLPNLVEEPWPPYPANCSLPPSKDLGFLVHILWTLSQRKIPVLTIPPALTAPKSLDRMLWRPLSSLARTYFPATYYNFQLIHGEC